MAPEPGPMSLFYGHKYTNYYLENGHLARYYERLFTLKLQRHPQLLRRSLSSCACTNSTNAILTAIFRATGSSLPPRRWPVSVAPPSLAALPAAVPNPAQHSTYDLCRQKRAWRQKSNDDKILLATRITRRHRRVADFDFPRAGQHKCIGHLGQHGRLGRLAKTGPFSSSRRAPLACRQWYSFQTPTNHRLAR